MSAATFGLLTRQRLNRVEARLARGEQIERVVSMAANPTTRTARLSTAVEGVSLDVIVLADGNAMVWKNRLPALSPQRSYFLWAVVTGQRARSGASTPAGFARVVVVSPRPMKMLPDDVSKSPAQIDPLRRAWVDRPDDGR